MRVTYETMYQEFLRVLEKRGFTHERAALSAKLYADANQEAIGMYRNLAKRCTDAVAFEEKENILYAVQNADAIEKEVKAMQQLGLKADLITQTELPFPVAAAVSL